MLAGRAANEVEQRRNGPAFPSLPLYPIFTFTSNSRPTSLLPTPNCDFELRETRVQSRNLRYLAIPADRTGLTLAAAELAEKAPRTTSGLSA